MAGPYFVGARQHWARTVIYERVSDYLELGWMIRNVNIGGSHSNYALLMIWPCECRMVEPIYVKQSKR